jgi:hypothetical protein
LRSADDEMMATFAGMAPISRYLLLTARCAGISSTSVTVTGAGCSIISTAAVSATVSTAGATGGFNFRAAFFTGTDLGLALATVRFAAFAGLDTLRALPRLADFAFRSFARCTFDSFLRLAMMKLP